MDKNARFQRHARFVRVTHWLSTIAIFALMLSGGEVVLSHPRFYWGEIGNVNVTPAFTLPVPSSRGTVPTGYNFVLPDQNGWSLYLHFQSAWLLLFTGLVYGVAGFARSHFQRNLVPVAGDRSFRALGRSIAAHMRFQKVSVNDAHSYNLLQRLSYLVMLFVLAPLIVWTGLAMAPGFTAVFPWSVSVLGGRQTARTLHFFLTGAFVLFTLAHVGMLLLAGFRARVQPMITGTMKGAS
ncbi:cytochrome b/b6 domain-containing protein [Gemmatimonas sp.]|uniref:cytochrome b/b6 domain-containing protein n=1 Tax=Gemmatimonas sp. TaxID=1962908 RepID=UPI003982FB49